MLLWLLSGVALAEEPARSKEHLFKEYIDASTRAFDAGDYNRSVAALSEAYRIRPVPPILYNLGRAHQAAGNVEEALTAYGRFLKADPKSPRRPDVERYMAQLREALGPEPPPAGAGPLLLREAPLTEPPPAPLILSTQAPGPRPLHRRPWFWLVVAGAAAVTGAAIATGVTVGRSSGPPDPDTLLGTRTVSF